jgi:hypothetical protein
MLLETQVRHFDRELDDVRAVIAATLRSLRDTSRVADEGRVVRMTRGDIENRLRECERAWEQATGERLSSADFYERFCAGDFDTRFGTRWATYYEATAAPQALVPPAANAY